MIADKGYDSGWFRQALSRLKISPCIPGRSNRKAPITYDTKIYRQRNLVKRMFSRLKDWRRIARIWSSLYLVIFIQNLLVHLPEKIPLMQPLTFGGDYPVSID
jgi:transposase